MPEVTTNFAEWDQSVRRFAAVSGKSFLEAILDQGRLAINEIIKRTPPFSGKALGRMLEARHLPKGVLDPEIESMTARAVGTRRVEKDIRKVIYGVRGASLSSKHGDAPEMSVDFGVLQKCEGRQAIRVFSRKDGTVYGVDVANFKANASMQDMMMHHKQARTSRGRVTTTGERTRNIGRWRWMNVMVTSEKSVESFIKEKQRMVGQAKGGWAAGYMLLGGRMSKGGWVGWHADKAGYAHKNQTQNSVEVEITNNSAWASGGDPDRIIEKAFEGRVKALEGSIDREIQKQWSAAA